MWMKPFRRCQKPLSKQLFGVFVFGLECLFLLNEGKKKKTKQHLQTSRKNPQKTTRQAKNKYQRNRCLVCLVLKCARFFHSLLRCLLLVLRLLLPSSFAGLFDFLISCVFKAGKGPTQGPFHPFWRWFFLIARYFLRDFSHENVISAAQKLSFCCLLAQVIEETHGFWKKLREKGHGSLWVG